MKNKNKKIKIEVSKIIVIINKWQSDKVLIQTTLPYDNGEYNGTTLLEFQKNHREGAEFVRKHFGIEPEIIYLADV